MKHGLVTSRQSITSIKVFSCIAYAHIAKEERKKLDVKAKKCILLGYGVRVKGYRLYDIQKKKVFYSRDVVFDEGSCIEDSEDQSQRRLIEFECSSDDAETTDVEEPHDNEEPATEVRRSTRIRGPPNRFGEWVNSASVQETQSTEPDTVQEALNCSEWKEAMEQEIASLESNDVYELVDLPKGKKPVGCKWVFKRKINADGSLERYKARLVAQGFSQTKGQDYDETFSPVIRYESVRSIIALAAQKGLILQQMDVLAAFLNGDLEEEVYMKQPEGFSTKKDEHKVWKLKKSLYGLKQAPRCWNMTLDNHLKSMGFEQTSSDPCLYVSSEGELFIIAVYVDDIIYYSCRKEQ